MKKNCAFELYRFLFSAVILAFHGRYNWNITSDKSFGAGFLAVEFFFLLSGFLMMQHQEKNRDTQSSAEDQAVRYLVRRFRRLFPLYAVSLVGAMLLRWYVHGKPITVTYLFREMPEFFMLQVFWAPMKINGALWFISAMLWASFLVYYLVLKNKAFFTRIFFPLGLLLFCSWASVKAGHIDIVNNVYYFWLGGFLRAFFEIGFGCSLYQIYIWKGNLLAQNTGNDPRNWSVRSSVLRYAVQDQGRWRFYNGIHYQRSDSRFGCPQRISFQAIR